MAFDEAPEDVKLFIQLTYGIMLFESFWHGRHGAFFVNTNVNGIPQTQSSKILY